jgi:hypothetical protein
MGMTPQPLWRAFQDCRSGDATRVCDEQRAGRGARAAGRGCGQGGMCGEN